MLRPFLLVSGLTILGLPFAAMGDVPNAPREPTIQGATVIVESTSLAIVDQPIQLRKRGSGGALLDEFNYAFDTPSNDFWVKQDWLWTFDSGDTLQFLPEHVWTELPPGANDEVLALRVPGNLCQGGQVDSVRTDFSFGKYRAKIKTATPSNVVNAFFYFHPTTGEIDVEFETLDLQAPPYIVQFTTDTPSGGTHFEEVIDFNPSDGYHVYGFDWHEGGPVEFFIDGVKIPDFSSVAPIDPFLMILNNWSCNPDFGAPDGEPPSEDAIMRVDWVYHTSFETDPPTVTAHSSGSDPNTNITISFSEYINPDTLSAETVEVVGSLSGSFFWVGAFDPFALAYTIDPVIELPVGDVVTVTVTTGVEDLAGNALAEPYEFSFEVLDSGKCDELFADHVLYGAEDGPNAVVIGDLNGDGHVDLALANEFSNNVSVLMNNGDGTFAGAGVYGTGNAPCDAAIGDLDGDGDLDVVTNNFDSDNVSVLLNNGDGSFASDLLFGVGDGPEFVAIGDLDSDGDGDLAVVNSLSDNVSVLLNQGDGTFAADVLYGAGDLPICVAIGDLDGDGDADLTVTNTSSDNVSVLLNNGDGTFAPDVLYGAGDGPVSVAIGDLDGDGDADLAVTNYLSDNVSILLNDGDATFAADVLYGAGDYPASVAIGDLDGDGDADLAVANLDSDNVSVLLNAGNGTFPDDIFYGVGDGPVFVSIADLNSNGALDLAVANLFSDNVSVLINQCIDCNGNGVPDSVDIAEGTSQDCNENGIPDECIKLENDCNGNNVPDFCDLIDGISQDCNANGIPDECDIAGGTSEDCNANEIPDECDGDCNGNGVVDECDIAEGTSEDCNGNGVPDECDIADGTSGDSNLNGVPDECEELCETNEDCDDGVDCTIDFCDLFFLLCDHIDVLCPCEGDANGDGAVDPLDAGFVLARFGCPVGTGDPDCDAADVNGDGNVDPLDSGFVLARFGDCL